MTPIKCAFWNSFEWLWRTLAVPPYQNLVTSKNEHLGGLHWESLCVLPVLNHHIWAPFLAIYLIPQRIPMACPSFPDRILPLSTSPFTLISLSPKPPSKTTELIPNFLSEAFTWTGPLTLCVVEVTLYLYTFSDSRSFYGYPNHQPSPHLVEKYV